MINLAFLAGRQQTFSSLEYQWKSAVY